MPSIDVWICSRVSFSSIKPKALLMSSVISMEVRGLSLAKISASICGMMFPISICKVFRPAIFPANPGSTYPIILSLERSGAADELGELGGDSGLTCPVVRETKRFEQLVGTAAGLIHRCHTGSMFGGVGVEDGFVQLGVEDLGHELGDELLAAGFEDKIGVGGAGFLF